MSKAKKDKFLLLSLQEEKAKGLAKVINSLVTRLNVPVQVQVSRFGTRAHPPPGILDAAVYAQGQAISGGIDRIDHPLQVRTLIADEV